MLLFLLLETTKNSVTTKSLDGVYFTLGGTIVAAILALIASFVASRRASRTAVEVAILTTKAANELKDNDYKRDYYKKVIDKRIKALEEIESILGRFTSAEQLVLRTETGEIIEKRVHAYFRENNDAFLEGIIQVTQDDRSVFGTWCNNDTGKAVTEFIDMIVFHVREVNDSEVKVADDPLINRLFLFSLHFDEIEKKRDEIERFIGQEMATLYDVEGFFKLKYAFKE